MKTKKPVRTGVFLIVAVVTYFNFNAFARSLRRDLLSSQALQQSGLFDIKTEAVSPLRQKRIFTVVSTSCDPFQDWQMQALLHNHRKIAIPGDLVRLMACKDSNYVLPQHSYEKYRVVRTPDFDVDHPDDPYSPRNRPGGLHYWLSGLSDDMDLPQDNDVLVMVDPDMIFLSNQLNISLVEPGVGIGSQYALGSGWLTNNWVQQSCKNKCHSLVTGFHPSYGMPMALTAGDTRRHAKVWIEVTEEMRRLQQSWMTDMYSSIVSHRLVGNRIVVFPTMLSTPTSDDRSQWGEPWGEVAWNAFPQNPGIWVAHFCQVYKIGNFSWWKHDFRSLDIRKCDRSENFPSPGMEDLAAMERWRNGRLKQENEWEAHLSRTVWMLDTTWVEIRKAIVAYYEEFC